MQRLIDADALKYDFGEIDDGLCKRTELYVTNEAIAQQPTIEAEPHWIPCSERLPEEKGEYLVTYHPCYWDDVEGEIRVGIDTFRGRTTWAKKKYQRVIAWMPLPEPYKAAFYFHCPRKSRKSVFCSLAKEQEMMRQEEDE